ncbi:MAG: hypothetical protein IJX53_03340 [Clostridia bacterium]|nr:hypothetical protein [Clostridia bacterium]
MRIVRIILSFGAACAGLWLLDQAAPLWAAAEAWLDDALTVSGARIYLRLGELTLTFDRGLMVFLGEKWSAICAMSARLIPPGTAEASGEITDAIVRALEAFVR